MPIVDLPADELRAYVATVDEPADLDSFWADALATARASAVSATFEPVDTGLRLVTTYDVTFRGCDGDAVRGWLHLPAGGTPGRLPAVVQYQGYGGGRGLPAEDSLWAVAGYAHLVMDTRGQGSGWSVGDTPDPVGSAPSQPGFLTRGIEDPHDHYYHRVFVDAVRAVDAIRTHPVVDPDRVAVAGGSQGGGMAIAVAGLVTDVAAVLADVPFLCDVRRAADVAVEGPYRELVDYLACHRDRVEIAFRTLAYMDGTVLGRRATAPALFSVAHQDLVCPPSTVHAAFRAYGGKPKELVEYPFNGHEGGGAWQRRRQLEWLAAIL
jgi:cephalosporin-C deacetylase